MNGITKLGVQSHNIMYSVRLGLLRSDGGSQLWLMKTESI